LIAKAVPVDGVGRGGAEVHVEVLFDIGRPVHLFRESGGPGKIVLKAYGRFIGINEVLAPGIIDIRNEIEVGFGVFELPSVIEIAGYAVGAVQIGIGGTVSAFGSGSDLILDIVDRCAGVEGGEQHMVIRRIKGLIQHPEAVDELGLQVLIASNKIDIVRGGGQGLQLAGAGAAGPPHIVDPQPLVIVKRIIELDSRREIRITTGYVDAFSGI